MAKKKAATRHHMSAAEKFYIEQHVDMELEQLATDLKLPESVVDRYRKKLLSEVKKEEKTEETKASPSPRADDFMIKKKDYGAVVMTQTAAERADESRKSYDTNTYYKNAIQKIRE